MKTLTISILLFSFSAGLANASYHPHRHMTQNAWQAIRLDTSQKLAPPCHGIPGPQAQINASGEYVPSIFDPGPGTD